MTMTPAETTAQIAANKTTLRAMWDHAATQVDKPSTLTDADWALIDWGHEIHHRRHDNGPSPADDEAADREATRVYGVGW